MTCPLRAPICPSCRKTLEVIAGEVPLLACLDGHGGWASPDLVRQQLREDPRHWEAFRGPFGVALTPAARMSPVHPEDVMSARRHRGMQIDVCMRSGGIWLDYDEIVRTLDIDSRRLPPRQEPVALDVLASYGIEIVLELVWSLISTGTR